jgi:hypothetical protein
LEPVIDLAPSAEHLPIARDLADRVRDNVLRDASKRADFNHLRGTMAVIVDDAGLALTLRFDYGRLVVHGTIVGSPDVTLRGDRAVVEALSKMPDLAPLRLPFAAFGDRHSLAALKSAVEALRAGRLKIYGLGLHPRLVFRVLRLISNGGASAPTAGPARVSSERR